MPTAYLSASLLKELTDVSVTPGAGNTGYPLIWNNTSGKFELAVLGVGGGGTGITSFGTGVATALGQNVTGSGSIVLATSPTLVTPTLGAASATSLSLTNPLAVTSGGTGSNTGVLTTGLISGIYQDVGSSVGTFGSFVDTSAFCERLHLANLLYGVTSSNFNEPTSYLFDGLTETFCTVSSGQTSAEILINFGAGNHPLSNLDTRAFSYAIGRLAISHYGDRRNGTYSIWIIVRADINGIATTETLNIPPYGNVPFGEIYLGEFTPVNSSSPSTTFINIPNYIGIKNIRIVFNRPRPNNTDPLFSISSIRYFPARLNPNGERYNVHLAPSSVKLDVFGTTASTSTTTGAAQVAGGLGVAGAIHGGSSLTLASDASAAQPAIVAGTNNGLKIGTATSQKLGFFNATPVVQPTTGVAEAAYVENSGGVNVNDDSTFDGYTLRQVVKALRNLGILA